MGNGLSILVLDDEPLVGDRLKPALEQDGYHVEAFTDPRLALERLAEKEFDIVLTDIRMENVDGIQILDSVSKMSKRTKVLMITGYATMQLARKAMAKGAFDFIAKPFKIGDIREMVEKAAEALRAEPRPAEAPVPP
jgi:DNA-binding NtrC family response regulator